MESVLLSTVDHFPNNKLDSSTCAAVKVDDFYLSTGSAFASVLASSDYDSVVEEIRNREFYAISAATEDNAKFLTHQIYCIACHRSRLIDSSVEKDLFDVEFEETSTDVKLTKALLGTVVLFSQSKKHTNVEEAIHKIYNHILPINRNMIGSPVTVISTPYKTLSFFNAHSRGVISNVFGYDKCLFLTDVKLTAGCEGSPVFSIYGELVGLIMSVFTWCKGEWMGFTLCVHLYPILKSWLNLSKPKMFFDVQQRYWFLDDHSVDSYGVVVVTSPNKWGSGVVVDRNNGIVVTCSHVVNYSAETDIRIEYNSKSFVGRILYATPRGVPFDIAVLKVRSSNFSNIIEFEAPTRAIQKGEAVYVIAYPLFSFRRSTIKGPSITYGHVSSVYPDCMILTTCATNKGASGGALVRANGELLGLVSNNVTVSEDNILIPHMTIVIPATVFLERVRKYSRSGSLKELNYLNVSNKTIQDVWNLSRLNKFVKCKL